MIPSGDDKHGTSYLYNIFFILLWVEGDSLLIVLKVY